jgi:hypothetical protein
MTLEEDKNSSLEITQPAENAGKTPYLFALPNLEEPSLRIEALSKYLP